MYLNTEAGKRLPFPNKFKSFKISDPYQVYEGFDHATAHPEQFNGIVLDSLTFLMDMYEEPLHLWRLGRSEGLGELLPVLQGTDAGKGGAVQQAHHHHGSRQR